MKNIFLLIFAAFIITGCGNNKQEKAVESDTKATQAAPKADEFVEKDSLKAVGQQVLISLKENNFEELRKYFSEDGVLFSPYGYIDSARSKKLSPDEFINAIDKKWILTWGSYDGTGNPIKLTVKAYLKKFVYNADYVNAEAIGFDEVIKQGNSTNNLKEIYPKSHFIDFHFSGFDQKLKGMDWTSLRLVFEKRNGEYFLVAIVHDQWTV
ncbi:hypothetical protein WG904_05950 [Pedobacter sp. Du54]|uniref:hypothetical protein n=1 Tax=Pedobacter anseongensis TaxID=3133439 RepID=UPI00309AD522